MLLLRDSFVDNDAALGTDHYPEYNIVGSSYENSATSWTIENNKLVSPVVTPGLFGIDVGQTDCKVTFKGFLREGTASDPSVQVYLRADAVNDITDSIQLKFTTDSIDVINIIGGVSTTIFTQKNPDISAGEHTFLIKLEGATLTVDIGGRRVVDLTSGIYAAPNNYFLFSCIGPCTTGLVYDSLIIETVPKTVTPRNSWWSFSDIKADVVRGLKDGAISTADIEDYINKAYREIYYMANWKDRKRTDYMTLYAGVGDYEMPVEAEDIIVVASSNWALISKEDIGFYLLGDIVYFDSFRQEQKGMSSTVRFEGNTLKLDPIPSEATGYRDTVKIEYFAELGIYDTNGEFTLGKLSTDTDYPALHPALHDLISLKAQILAIEDVREYDGVYQAKSARYRKLMKDVKYKITNPTRYPNRAEIMR